MKMTCFVLSMMFLIPGIALAAFILVSKLMHRAHKTLDNLNMAQLSIGMLLFVGSSGDRISPAVLSAGVILGGIALALFALSLVLLILMEKSGKLRYGEV